MYYLGMATQSIVVIIVLIIFSVISYLGIRVHFQERKIIKLESTVKECESQRIQVEENNGFLKENMRINNEYYAKRNKREKQRATPNGDVFDVKNLFKGDPR